MTTGRGTHRRGFTLIEVAASIAIAAVITTAALSTTVSLHRQFVTNRKLVAMSDDVRVTLDHVLTRVRNVGGGPVRPWQALSLSCGVDPAHPLPACDLPNRKGRLHVALLDPQLQGVIANATSSAIEVEKVSGVCPLSGGITPVVIFPPESKLAALGGPAWRTGVCIPTTGSSCKCELVAGGNAVGFSVPGASTPLTDAMLTGGVVISGRVSTFYVDPTSEALSVLTDLQRLNKAERTNLIPNLAAFQAQLGYDVDGDGALDSPLRTSQLNSAPQALRSVRVGVALSRKAADQRTRTAPFFETTISTAGAMAVSLEGTAFMRANGVFQ